MTTDNNGVIYYRVSTSEQAERGFSLENQKQACLKYADNKGIKIVEEFHDDGFSAKTTDRDGLQAMLKYCYLKSNKVKFVIVYKVDRLSRDVIDYSTIQLHFKKCCVRLLSTTENIDETPVGKFIGNVMAAVAQQDNDVRGERTTDGLKKCFLSGRWPFKAHLGYLNSVNQNKDKIIIIDPDRGKLITYIFNEFAKGVYSQEDIRKKVNALGLRSCKGKEISMQLIHKILHNKFYIGVMIKNGVQQKGTHEPLTTVDIFNECQKHLRGFNKSKNQSLSHVDENFPLRHFVLCGHCQRPLTGSFSTGKSKRKFPYYRCYNSKCPTTVKSIPKKMLEDRFIEYIRLLSPTKKYFNALRAVVIDLWETKYQNINLNKEILTKKMEQLKQDRQKIVDLAKKDIIDADEAKADMDKIRGQILETEIQLGQSKQENFDMKEALDHCYDLFINTYKYWEKGNYDQKMRLQSSLFSKKPSYFYPEFGTPEFSLIFQQKRDLTQVKSLLVARTGIEPVFLP